MIEGNREQEREELHKTIWAMSNELRGSVDGWDFKQYVLGTIFYRFISENLSSYINTGEEAAGNAGFKYEELTDEMAEEAKQGLIEEKGFFIYPSQLFCNVLKNAKKDENLNITLEKVFRSIEGSAIGTPSEENMKGLFEDFDVNSTRLGKTVQKRNEKLVQLLEGIANMNLGASYNHAIDVFGDAYEYLMGMYASNAGKVGGEYFTPQEVAELLAKLATAGKENVRKVYDPACGSGSLLLQVSKVIGSKNVRNGFYGQEISPTTYNLCRINMFLHEVGYDKFNIACEDTLLEPQHWDDGPFDVIVSNPPYSIKWKGEDNPLLINDPRFAPAGVLAPRNNSDFAFIMHSLSWLAETGTAAFVCFPGIMYRGGAEQKIRKYLIDNNFVDCVIQLPDNMFFGVGIFTCILILKKNRETTDILFIDATKEHVKEGNKNKLSAGNISNILNAYLRREDVEHFSKNVTFDQISNKVNDYILSVSTYIDKEDNREEVNIEQLNNQIKEISIRRNQLNSELDELLERLAR